MAFRIATDLIARIVAEAAASPGVEVCGLLLGTADQAGSTSDNSSPFAPSLSRGRPQAARAGQVLRQARHERRGEGVTIGEARPCRNVAADPARRFEIDPAALLAAHRAARAGGPAILGCYHSHPSGVAEPSACDAAAAEPNGWLWLIVAGDQVRGFRAVGTGMLHGRFEEECLLG